MSDPTNEEPQHDAPETGGEAAEDEDLDGMMSSIRKADRRQKVRAALYAVSVIVLIVVAIYAWYAYRDQFIPNIDMEEAGQMAWEKTNDPQCRSLIDQVTEIGEDFYEYESVIEEHILGDDPEKIREIRRRLDTFEARLNKAEELSDDAELRYEDSARQLEDWFEYVDTEIGFVDQLAEERLAQLEREADSEGAGSDGSDEDGGILVYSADADQKARVEDDDAPEKTPVERRDGALIALHDAFQNFRVWHSANAHPCGAAAEDEKPWRPESGSGSNESEPAEAPTE
ncbi:MAG: hypothetical protein ACQEVA_19495 [Myxococcota bacterium]